MSHHNFIHLRFHEIFWNIYSKTYNAKIEENFTLNITLCSISLCRCKDMLHSALLSDLLVNPWLNKSKRVFSSGGARTHTTTQWCVFNNSSLLGIDFFKSWLIPANSSSSESCHYLLKFTISLAFPQIKTLVWQKRFKNNIFFSLE